MSKVNTGGNAFPTGTWEYGGQNNVLPYQEKGMSLRDYFAAQALSGFCANLSAILTRDVHFKNLAEDAWRIADAMLAERERGE